MIMFVFKVDTLVETPFLKHLLGSSAATLDSLTIGLVEAVTNEHGIGELA